MTMQITEERITPADTAKMIRAALKTAFPGTKFRVRLSRGNATYVDWTDGPTRAQVCDITDEFTSQGFDASTDMRTYNDSRLYANADGSYTERRYSSGLMIEQRSASDEVWADLMVKMSRFEGLSDYEAETFAWREFSSIDYSGLAA